MQSLPPGYNLDLMLQSAVVAERAGSPRGLRLNVPHLGAALGVWISLFPFIDLAMRSRTTAIAVGGGGQSLASPILLATYLCVVLTGIIPILSGALAFGVDFRRARLFAPSIIILCLSIPISLLSTSEIENVQYVLLVYYIFGCAMLLVAINVDGDELLRAFFTAVALTLSAAMIAALIDHDYAWGRLWGRMAPNYWGGLALTTILASIAMRRWMLKIPLIGLSLFVIYSSQSRGEMISLVVTALLATVLLTRRQRPDRWIWVWLAAALALGAILVLRSDFIFNDLLKLLDRRRGLNSGFTGRVEGWREAQDIFASHPWFGVGYQQHDRFMTSNVGIHSGYLATLADTGIVGFLGYMLFSFGALCRALVRAWNKPVGVNVAMAAFLFAFSVVGLVEPSGVHTGDTVAMLMIFVAAWAWRDDLDPAGAQPGQRRRQR